jgi:hypothetical protein
MYVFVDASGDPGLKILSGSSRYFTIALVAIQDEDVADCNSRIDQLRNTLMFPPSYEFHFSANSRKVRQAFLAAVASSKFFYHIYALDKSDLSTLKRLEITNSESLFRYVIMQACDNAKTYLNLYFPFRIKV